MFMLGQVMIRSAKPQPSIRTFAALHRTAFGERSITTGSSVFFHKCNHPHAARPATVAGSQSQLPHSRQDHLQGQQRHFHSRNYDKPPPKKPFYKSREMQVVAGLGAALAAFLIYKDYSNNEQQKKRASSGVRSGESLILVNKPPEQKIARSIYNPKDASGLKLTLYQYQTCPFCCKLRAFLDYHGFSYDVVEVNSVTRTQTKWTTYRKVPFLLVEVAGSEYGDSTMLQLKDSSVIISMLTSVLRNPKESLLDILESYPSYYSDDNKLQFSNRFSVMYGDNDKALKYEQQIQDERHWRQWVDDVFVHVLSPNVYRTPSEALQAFNWFSEVGDWEKLFSSWERLLVVYFGAAVMWVIGKRLKSRYNLESDPRQSLYKEAETWSSVVSSSGGRFAGGDRPNLADLNMYGVLTAIEGCEAFQDLMGENRRLHSWYAEMKNRVRNREGEQALVKRCLIR